MVKKAYTWKEGATLDDHSRRKHKVLREYFAEYLKVRCSLFAQEKFRLAIVDGFAGGGRYDGDLPGSPVIFLEELIVASVHLNAVRSSSGGKPIKIECLLVFNDEDPEAVAALRVNIANLVSQISETPAHLEVRIEFRNAPFEEAITEIEGFLKIHAFSNVLFNLDQYGHAMVARSTIRRIMALPGTVEAFYTFSISSLISFLTKKDPARFRKQLAHLDIDEKDLMIFSEPMSSEHWMGTAEKIVFDAFSDCAPFHSPFSINNPGGWRYWLVHFSRQYRAREVYNQVLHNNATMQAHFGRSGLNMLAYDPSREGELYLFDDDGRQRTLDQLTEDIPRIVSAAGDTVSVGEFYESIYNLTPAHADDIRDAMFAADDLQVITSTGGSRRSSKRVQTTDLLSFKPQRSFFPLFTAPLKRLQTASKSADK